MLEQASQLQVPTNMCNNIIKCSDSNSSCLTTVSPITESCTDYNKQHTKILLKGGKQLWCMWCSRVNLLESKNTLMFARMWKGLL